MGVCRGRAPRPMASRRQAGGRHLQRRSIAVVARGMRPIMRSSRRGRGAQVGEDVLEAVVAQHRALEARRADVDPEQVQQVVGTDGGDVGQRLALDLVGQQRGARLADGAAAAGERDPVDDAVGHAEHQRDPVAAQRVGALVRRVGVLDDPEVVGSSIVLEDVVAIQVVHAHSSVARSSNPDQRGRIWPEGTPADRAAGTKRRVVVAHRGAYRRWLQW